MPGRRTPGRNILALKRAEATIAPVLPAETTASTSPAAIMPQHREIELSRFFLRASTGFSSMPMAWLAWTIGRRSRGAAGALASSASIRSRSPTSTTVRSVRSATASQAPATIGPGAKSPPIASKRYAHRTTPSVLAPSARSMTHLRKNDVGMRESGRSSPFRIPKPSPARRDKCSTLFGITEGGNSTSS